ncbi:hypothetical protein BC938DRAFT_479927 [Jimgerdemannia flammicorona]|uniref:Uncharacterized protein n=1 Tax=Jimgerdemannia flammicorona TaxID=994334 RepID=A0A433QJS9_9FUNG|nr:hypothetical protein BC938DRAFT_479927 [Jimgerdemannia flammicorona]
MTEHPERIKMAAETYQRVSQRIDALGQVDEELTEKSNNLSRLTEAFNKQMEIRKELTKLSITELKAVGDNNVEALFWIRKRAQERDAKVNDIVDGLNKQVEKAFVAKQELLNKKEQFDLYEAQLTELFASVFDGSNRAHSVENTTEQEMHSVKSEMDALKESVSDYQQALYHLRTAGEDVTFAVTCLHRYASAESDGALHESHISPNLLEEPPAPRPSLSSSNSSSLLRSGAKRGVTSPRTSISGESSKDKDAVAMTLTDFHDILSYTARAQKHVEQARSLVPDLPDTSKVKIADHGVLIKETDFGKDPVITPKRKLYFSREKITTTLLTLMRVSNPILRDLISFTQRRIQDLEIRRDELTAKFKIIRNGVLGERRQIFEKLLTQASQGDDDVVVATPGEQQNDSSGSRYGAELVIVENSAMVLPTV